MNQEGKKKKIHNQVSMLWETIIQLVWKHLYILDKIFLLARFKGDNILA